MYSSAGLLPTRDSVSSVSPHSARAGDGWRDKLLNQRHATDAILQESAAECNPSWLSWPLGIRVSKTATHRFESLIPQDWGFAAFVAVLLLSPLWYGSVLVSAQLGNCAALACIAGWLAISARREGVIGNPPPAFLAAAVLFVSATAWALIQSSWLVSQALQHPLWAMAAKALQAPIWGAISLNPERTWLGVAEWLTIGQMFLLAFIFGKQPRRARSLVHAVGTAGAVYSVYGILDVVMGIDHILFVPKNPYTLAQGIHYVAATFINADHYAAFAGIAVAVYYLEDLDWPLRAQREIARTPVRAIQ